MDKKQKGKRNGSCALLHACNYLLNRNCVNNDNVIVVGTTSGFYSHFMGNNIAGRNGFQQGVCLVLSAGIVLAVTDKVQSSGRREGCLHAFLFVRVLHSIYGPASHVPMFSQIFSPNGMLLHNMAQLLFVGSYLEWDCHLELVTPVVQTKNAPRTIHLSNKCQSQISLVCWIAQRSVRKSINISIVIH